HPPLSFFFGLWVAGWFFHKNLGLFLPLGRTGHNHVAPRPAGYFGGRVDRHSRVFMKAQGRGTNL
ncbi:hypothetical protein, partial [Streptomyces celluloflavus]